jgi:aspartokinase
VERVAITSGLRLAQSIEILSGLEVDDQVVIKGFLGLSAGKSVSVLGRQG